MPAGIEPASSGVKGQRLYHSSTAPFGTPNETRTRITGLRGRPPIPVRGWEHIFEMRVRICTSHTRTAIKTVSRALSLFGRLLFSSAPPGGLFRSNQCPDYLVTRFTDFPARNPSIPPPHLFLAGVAGLEPANAGVKVPCLTTWRYPNMETPIGFEPMILGLQPRALPLGYGIVWWQ